MNNGTGSVIDCHLSIWKKLFLYLIDIKPALLILGYSTLKKLMRNKISVTFHIETAFGYSIIQGYM
jgi:hypothetical protein